VSTLFLGSQFLYRVPQIWVVKAHLSIHKISVFLKVVC